MDAIKLLKDVVTVAQKSNDIDMVQKVIAAQEEVIELQDKVFKLQKENNMLKEKLKRSSKIVRYRGIPLITIEDDKCKIIYCANCYGKEEKLIPVHITDDIYTYCGTCGDRSNIKYSPDYEIIKETLKDVSI